MTDNRYNYREALADDIREYIAENINIAEYASRDDLADYLNDELWTADSVTGNASGSYYCNAYKAENALHHNMDLLVEACEEFGEDLGEAVKRGAEFCDVTIRCYLLGEMIATVLDDIAFDDDIV